MATLPSTLPWYQRLDARVAAGISFVVALALGAALVATTRAVTTRALTRAGTDLESARAAFDHLVADRAEFAASQAALVAAVPVFRAHLTEPSLASDAASLDAMAADYRGTMKADFAIVAGENGRWMAAPGWPAGVAATPAVAESVADATAGRSAQAIAEVGGRLFLV